MNSYGSLNEPKQRTKDGKETTTMAFTEILSNPEARQLVELIEELIGETEQELMRIRNEYINELKAKFGYEYII